MMTVNLPCHSMVTRLPAGILKHNPKYALTTLVYVVAEPTTVKEALSKNGWLKAMKDELEALEDNHNWDLVPKLPNMNVIGTKWVFKVKYKADNSVDRLKARLVAKGYNHHGGIDFSEMFSPVVKQAIVRSVLSIAAVIGWSIHQMDVKNTFINGSLNEKVFVSRSFGFKHAQFPFHVCRLRKAIYGLKQAPL